MTQFSTLPFRFPPFSTTPDTDRCRRKREATKLASPFGHSTVTSKSNFHRDGNHRSSIRIRRYPERFVRPRPPVAFTAAPGRKPHDNYYDEFTRTIDNTPASISSHSFPLRLFCFFSTFLHFASKQTLIYLSLIL